MSNGAPASALRAAKVALVHGESGGAGHLAVYEGHGLVDSAHLVLCREPLVALHQAVLLGLVPCADDQRRLGKEGQIVQSSAPARPEQAHAAAPTIVSLQQLRHAGTDAHVVQELALRDRAPRLSAPRLAHDRQRTLL